MIDASEFTSSIRLPAGCKLVPFFYGHLAMMRFNEHDQAMINAIPDWTMRMRAQADMGPSFTALLHGRPLLCFGVIPIWRGVAEAWMMPDKDIGIVTQPLCRVARQFFDWSECTMQLWRIQIIVRSSNVRAIKWAKFLYFQEEAVMDRYGPTGEDHILMRRLNNGRTFQNT